MASSVWESSDTETCLLQTGELRAIVSDICGNVSVTSSSQWPLVYIFMNIHLFSLFSFQLAAAGLHSMHLSLWLFASALISGRSVNFFYFMWKKIPKLIN